MNRIETSRWVVQQMLDAPPPSWRQVFRAHALPDRPRADEVVDVMLERTAGGSDAGPRGSSYRVPDEVRSAALRGLQLSYDNDYTGWNGIGLARAVQLATEPCVWKRSVERMYAFFSRNRRYMTYSSLSDDTRASKSWMAWLNWGGMPGYVWSGQLLGKPVNLG